jgi:hypothetical protein
MYLISKAGQTSSGAHIASCGVGTWAVGHGVIWPGCEAVHSPHLVLSLRMRGAIPLLPSTLPCHAQGQLSLIK